MKNESDAVYRLYHKWRLVFFFLPFYNNFLTSFNLYLYKFVVNIYLNFLYQVLLLCYPFLWLKLYLHMFKQRRSKLGKHHEKKKLWSLDLFQIQMLVNCHLLVLLEFWVLGYRLLRYSSNYFLDTLMQFHDPSMWPKLDAHYPYFYHVAIVYMMIYGVKLCANFRNFYV